MQWFINTTSWGLVRWPGVANALLAATVLSGVQARRFLVLLVLMRLWTHIPLCCNVIWQQKQQQQSQDIRRKGTTVSMHLFCLRFWTSLLTLNPLTCVAVSPSMQRISKKSGVLSG